MRILIPMFSPATGTWGGLTRVLAIAAAAERSGHQVAFCAAASIAENLRQHGYSVYPTPEATMFGLPEALSRKLEKRSQNITPPFRPGASVGNIWLIYWFSGMIHDEYLTRLLTAELYAERDFHPDLIFTDIDPAAYMLSSIKNLPVATTFQGVMLQGVSSLAWKKVKHALERAMEGRVLYTPPPEKLFFGEHVLKIIPSIPELDGTNPDRPDVRYTGQLLGNLQPPGDTGFQLDPNRRYVFVYMGTGSLALNALRRVLPQIYPAGGDTTCLVGSQSIAQVERIGAVEFHPYVPVEQVLPQCDWVFCHGGQNTIAQALLHGVPLILFPGAVFERRFNAKKVQENGAGLMGESDQFNADWLTAALARKAEVTAPAGALGARIRAFGGAAAAVQAMEQWLQAAAFGGPPSRK